MVDRDPREGRRPRRQMATLSAASSGALEGGCRLARAELGELMDISGYRYVSTGPLGKAVVMNGSGGRDVLEYAERPDPTPAQARPWSKSPIPV
jgi:hypothetical protein